MYEYSWFMARIREYLEQGQKRDSAIGRVMKDCVRKGIMEDFIREHGTEVRNMLFTEFNLEEAREVWEQEAWEEGQKAGRLSGRQEGRREGEMYKLVEMVCKKLKKNKSPEEIADELEEDPDKIQKICQTASFAAPQYDADRILALLDKS